ncbi:hypothetical protein J6590_091711, partial [Homalodisca vitripennis]
MADAAEYTFSNITTLSRKNYSHPVKAAVRIKLYPEIQARNWRDRRQTSSLSRGRLT